jgi:hypothetical protein
MALHHLLALRLTTLVVAAAAAALTHGLATATTPSNGVMYHLYIYVCVYGRACLSIYTGPSVCGLLWHTHTAQGPGQRQDCQVRTPYTIDMACTL